MKIFVAGATGVVGRRLVRILAQVGHEVVGMTRTPEKAEILRGLGATVRSCGRLGYWCRYDGPPER